MRERERERGRERGKFLVPLTAFLLASVEGAKLSLLKSCDSKVGC